MFDLFNLHMNTKIVASRSIHFLDVVKNFKNINYLKVWPKNEGQWHRRCCALLDRSINYLKVWPKNEGQGHRRCCALLDRSIFLLIHIHRICVLCMESIIYRHDVLAYLLQLKRTGYNSANKVLPIDLKIKKVILQFTFNWFKREIVHWCMINTKRAFHKFFL